MARTSILLIIVSALALVSSSAGAQILTQSCPFIRSDFKLPTNEEEVERVIIRDGGDYSGTENSDIFRVIGANAVDITIMTGSGVDTLDVSTVQQGGETAILGGTAFPRNLTLDGVNNILGSSGGDDFIGNGSLNHILGYGGDDIIESRNNSNILIGGAGNDHVSGGLGNDYVSGGMDDDFLLGNEGNDVIDGGAGRDVLFGGAGDDLLISGAGGDYEPFKRPMAIPSVKSPTKQDIVVVMFDDLTSFSDLLGEPSIVMPNLYAFSQESVRFDNAQANSPLCNPSRASLLAGVYPETSKVYGPLQNRNSPDSQLIQKHLQNNGFDVGEFGKVRNHTESTGNIGLENHFFRFRQIAASGDFGVLDVDDRAHLSELYSDAASVDAALAFLQTETTKPRATFLGITRPHGPWIVPHEDLAVINTMITNDDIRARAAANGQILGVQDRTWLSTIDEYTRTALGLSNDLGTEGEAINLIRHYLASAHLADRLFGEFMAQVPDDVTVIAAGDHGMHMIDRRTDIAKSTLWPQSLDVALFIRKAGYTGARSEVVGLVDLYGTIADLTGVDTPPHVEGRSVEPLIRQETGWDNVTTATLGQQRGTRATRNHDYIAWSVTTDEWHYIRNKKGDQELYDVINDSKARINIADSYPDVTKALSAYLPRSNDYLYGGSGSDDYFIGGGRTFINEGGARDSSDVDTVRLMSNFEDLTFNQVSWGNNDNGNSMSIRHNGGVTVLYNQYDSNLSQIEVLHLNDGCVFLD